MIQMQATERSFLDVIRTRRSIPRMKPDPIPREIVEELLDAAVWAPNHWTTEPWQFFVLDGDAKRRFAEMRREVHRTRLPDPDSPQAQNALEIAYRTTVQTPVIIVVTSRVAEDPEVREEDFWATFAAAYAFMLGAWSKGIGTYFRSGTLRDYPPLRQFLGLPDDRRILGFIYAGYPEDIPQKKRTPAREKTVWLDSSAP